MTIFSNRFRDCSSYTNAAYADMLHILTYTILTAFQNLSHIIFLLLHILVPNLNPVELAMPKYYLQLLFLTVIKFC